MQTRTTVDDDAAFLRNAVEHAMAEKAVAVRRQRELAAQVDQLKVGHSRVQQQLQSQSDSLEKRVHILEIEVKRSAQSESMMRQQVSLLKSQLEHEVEQRAAGEELCGALAEMLRLVSVDIDTVESEAVRLAAVEDEFVEVLASSPGLCSPLVRPNRSPELVTSKQLEFDVCHDTAPADLELSHCCIETVARGRSPSIERAVMRAAYDAQEIADLHKLVEKLETALASIKTDQQKVVALARERCGTLATPEAQQAIEQNIAVLKTENRVLNNQIEQSKQMHTASCVFADSTEDEIYEEMIEEYSHTAGKVQTRRELVEAIELSQRHSDNPFEALVDELYRSYKGMKRALIKVKAEKVFLAEEITSLQVELDMMKLAKDESDRARKQLCHELTDAKARYTKIQQLLSTIKKHPTFMQLSGKG